MSAPLHPTYPEETHKKEGLGTKIKKAVGLKKDEPSYTDTAHPGTTGTGVGYASGATTAGTTTPVGTVAPGTVGIAPAGPMGVAVAGPDMAAVGTATGVPSDLPATGLGGVIQQGAEYRREEPQVVTHPPEYKVAGPEVTREAAEYVAGGTRVEREAPIVHEKPIVTERTIVHEKPVVTEQPVIYEKPIVHEQTVVHEQEVITKEKPVVHETHVVREQPIVQEKPVVVEKPRVVERHELRQQQRTETEQTRVESATTHEVEPTRYEIEGASVERLPAKRDVEVVPGTAATGELGSTSATYGSSGEYGTLPASTTGTAAYAYGATTGLGTGKVAGEPLKPGYGATATTTTGTSGIGTGYHGTGVGSGTGYTDTTGMTNVPAAATGTTGTLLGTGEAPVEGHKKKGVLEKVGEKLGMGHKHHTAV